MSSSQFASPATVLWALSLGLLLPLAFASLLLWWRQRRQLQLAQDEVATLRRQLHALLEPPPDEDAPQREALERQLHQREDLHSLLLANVPGFAYRCAPDDQRSVLFISGLAQRVSGWNATDFMAAPALLRQLAHPNERARVAAEREQAIARHQRYQLEYRALRRDGSAFWLREQGSAVRDGSGQVLWLDGVMLDISERKAMDEALCAARAQAEEARLSKTVFLANVGHELRTPLNAIIGFSEVVLRGALDAAQRPYVFKVRQSARALLRQLNDILDLARLERGPVPLDLGELSLRELVHEVLDAHRATAQHKGLALRLECAPELPERHQGDAQRLRQVLDKLLDNAVKFTEQGWVLLRIAQDGGDVLLTVQDTGIGIAPERQARIFEPFTQADGGASRRFGGAGVGTTLALRLVEHMGGRLQLDSTPGQGSSFTARLPLTPLGTQPAPTVAAAAPVAMANAAHGAALAAPALDLPPPWNDSLRQAIEALRGGDHADATLPSLLQGLRGHGLHQQAMQIEQALALFDLDRAAELLETLPGPLLP